MLPESQEFSVATDCSIDWFLQIIRSLHLVLWRVTALLLVGIAVVSLIFLCAVHVTDFMCCHDRIEIVI